MIIDYGSFWTGFLIGVFVMAMLAFYAVNLLSKKIDEYLRREEK